MEVMIYTFAELSIGMSASFETSWSKNAIMAFAQLSGDYNPLHVDDAYATATPFGRTVVHGMLVASSVSKLVGMYLPGKECLIVSESLSFKQPTFCDETVTVTGVITQKSEATKLVIIHITIQQGMVIHVVGDVTVLVRS